MLDGLQIDRVAIELPFWPYEIYWYGIIIVVGIALGTWWAIRELNRRRLGEKAIDEFYNGLILVVFAGYFFARFTYVVLDMISGAQYSGIADVLNFRAGGVNILGGFIGAVLVAWIYVRWRRLKFWHYADVAGMTILLAQGIGRWGNFINQELYGPPTTASWGILIDAAYRIPTFADMTLYPPETRFHPTFLYESVVLLVGFFLFALLNNKYRDTWKTGTLFGLFLVWWGGHRTWIEFFRPDQTTVGDTFLTYSMIAAFLIMLTGFYVLLMLYDKLPEQLSSKKRRPVKPKPRRS